MFEKLVDYFQTGPLPADQYFGVYDLRLVALSYMVAVFASYIALDLTGRLRDRNNTRTSSLLWLIGGSIAMGAGIWSMHFIGMLSFKIPGITLQYDLFWTGISLLVAIFASGFALYLLKKNIINVVHLIAGGVILGFAIASMHYTGMEGMLITLNIRYLPDLFLLSIIIAIVASEAAIWLALKSNKVILRVRNRIKFISAIIMGLAICGMHYTGMAASVFTPLCFPAVAPNTSLDPTILSMAIATVTFIILSVAYFASNYKEAMNQEQFEKARQLGMAEISASVLHSVGNVLNSVNVSANTISEKLATSKSSNLDKLCALLKEHEHDMADFLTNDVRGKKIINFLENQTQHQHDEELELSGEITAILKNIETIKDIISTQQTLSKNIGIENVTSINDLLDEALLITSLELKEHIKIDKHYGRIAPFLVDKVKLLQVLINLLHNAKDALLASGNEKKIITIKTFAQNDKIIVEIIDNGVGILPKNLNKIFYHGYTTKDTGHGFGLHSGALVINELGGEIFVESEGHEKGAMFRIQLPYKLP